MGPHVKFVRPKWTRKVTLARSSGMGHAPGSPTDQNRKSAPCTNSGAQSPTGGGKLAERPVRAPAGAGRGRLARRAWFRSQRAG